MSDPKEQMKSLQAKITESLQLVKTTGPIIENALNGTAPQNWALPTQDIQDKTESQVIQACQERMTKHRVPFMLCQDVKHSQNVKIYTRKQSDATKWLSLPKADFLRLWAASGGDQQKIATDCWEKGLPAVQ